MKRAILPLLLASCLGIGFGCANKQEKPRNKTKLIYFGFEDRSEKQEDAIGLAQLWEKTCPQWQATIKKSESDYEILFGGDTDIKRVTVIDRRGRVLYSGSPDVMMPLPNGNPDGKRVNICKLTQ